MKLNKTEIQSETIGDFTEVKSKINESNIPIIMRMVSQNLYSNPLGSMIREITSNCFDANKENDKETPINVTLLLDNEDNDYYAYFSDNGKGMSPDTMENVFMSWFSSSKRNSDDFIGGWGLGSKSPLAYDDYFFIITSNNNIKYEYLLSKEENDIPVLTLLSQNETKEEGTTIKIKIKREDIDNFHEECIKQLSYFQGVIVKTHKYFDNHYKLIEGNYFKYTTALYKPYRNLHISYGQVAYPLDFNKLGIDLIDVSVALKIPIGELDVTINREQIHYTERSIKVIKNYIKEATEELTQLFNKQNLKIESLVDYIQNRNKTISLKLDTHLLDLTSLGLRTKNIYEEGVNYESIKRILNTLYSVYYVSNGVAENDSNFDSLILYNSFDTNCYYTNSNLNRRANIYLGVGKVIKRNKLDKQNLTRILGFYLNNSYSLSRNDKKKYLFSEKNITKKIYELIKRIDNEILNLSSLKPYEQPTDEWYENYLQEQRLKNKELLDYRKTIIHYKDADERKKQTTIANLEKYAVVFYCYEDNTNIKDIRTYENIIKSMSMDKDYYIFMIINKTNYQKLKKLENLKELKYFFKLKKLQKTFNRFKLYEKYNYNIKEKLRKLKKYSNYYEELYIKINNYFDKHINNSYMEYNIYSLVKINVKTENTFEISKDIEELEKEIDKYDILSELSNISDISNLRKIINLFNLKKLNSYYYYPKKQLKTY